MSKGLPRVWKATVTYEVYVLSHRADEAADCAKLNRDCYADIEQWLERIKKEGGK
jgi:hypothetical protein